MGGFVPWCTFNLFCLTQCHLSKLFVAPQRYSLWEVCLFFSLRIKVGHAIYTDLQELWFLLVSDYTETLALEILIQLHLSSVAIDLVRF